MANELTLDGTGEMQGDLFTLTSENSCKNYFPSTSNDPYAGFQYFIGHWIGNLKIRFSEWVRFNSRIKLSSQFH